MQRTVPPPESPRDAAGRAPRHGAAAVRGIAVLALALVVGWLAGPRSAAGHAGPLDEYGGHFDEKTGTYHYHRPARDMAVRKSRWLHWERLPVQGWIKGTVSSVEDDHSFWLHVPYRPAYQEMTEYVLKENRDDRRVLLHIALSHVSPQETGSPRGEKFTEWFRSKVTYELRQKLQGKDVRVEFRLVGGSPGWLRGMVFIGQENVNLWMVVNGWSYYVMADGKTPYDGLFRKAEDAAHKSGAGIWEYIR